MRFSKLISDALTEDIEKGDITTSAIVPRDKIGKAKIIVKENCVIAGIEIVKAVLRRLDKKAIFISKFRDGTYVKKNTSIASIRGKISAILTSERVMLNFLQRLSGIATLTSKYVKKAYPVKIMDTRKTTPNLRALEKYAVRVGGGINHRFNLNSQILIKDNHIKVAGSIKEAVKRVKEKFPKAKIEVEVNNLKELRDAIDLNAEGLVEVNLIMLDNMNIRDIKKAIKIIDKKAKIEVSGGVNLKNVREIAKTGVDFISVGALTHSAKSIDISLDL